MRLSRRTASLSVVACLLMAVPVSASAAGLGVVTNALAGVTGAVGLLPGVGGGIAPGAGGAGPVGTPITIQPTYVSGSPSATQGSDSGVQSHAGDTWGDPLQTDLLNAGDAKLRLKYYGASTSTGTTQAVGFSLTIPE
ncbi:MAG: hypothetical protein ISS15_11645 [Alphaproteobacteria bacterium]|nr:hypothetical protein [Alphaproteobacteria bacterium]MBL6939852.1 hypothetical protein [Alphaproteobacteria bacterium]MBL7098305.1 hypothetical protein [Alphaproteobacteria bacterium]